MKLLTCLLCLIIGISVHGQTLTSAQLTADYDSLCHALKEAHGGLYRFHSRDEIDLLFRQQRKQLTRPMEQMAFYGFLSKLLATIGDGHMKIEPGIPGPPPLIFPLRIMSDRGKAIIISNDTKDNTAVRPGMELISVNGKSFAELKQQILPFLISDGFGQSGKLSSFYRNFSQYYRIFIDTASAFTVILKDSTGKPISVRLDGVRNSQRDANRNQNVVNSRINAVTKVLEGPADNVYLRFVNDSIAYLRVRYFVGDRFIHEIDSLFSIVDAKQAKRMILDLRGNGGGLDEYGAYLASKLTDKPFRYIDKVRARILIPSFASWKARPPVDLVGGTEPDPEGGYRIKGVLNSAIGLQQPERNPYTGKLVVMIDGKSFSAASDFSSILSNMRDAVFVGEETGGGYQGNTSALNAILSLPNSKFNVNIHLWDYWSAVKTPRLKGRGMLPDHTVERSATEWLKGIDRQWEAALKIALQK